MLALRAAVVAALTLAMSVVVGVAVGGPAGAAAAPQGDRFHSVTPTRVLDTRSGLGGHTMPGRSTIHLTIAGANGVPSNATAVAVNLTTTRSAQGGYVTAWPSGVTRPGTSSVTFTGGQTVANLAIVRLGNGGIDLYNGSPGKVDVLADVTGFYFGPTGASDVPGGLVPLNPARVLDTRTSGRQLAAGSSTPLVVAGRGGIPSTGAAAVVVDLTTTRGTKPGYVTAWANGSSQPSTSSVNVVPNLTVANLAVVSVGNGGAIRLFNGSTAGVDLVIDVVGYIIGPIANPASDGTYVPLSPSRVLDTRSGLGATTPSGKGYASVPVTGVGTVPSQGVGAVVVEVTATRATSPGYITAWDGSDLPPTSTVDFVAGQTTANLAIVPVGCDGRIEMYNGSLRPADIVADVVGYVPATRTPCWRDVSPTLPPGPNGGDQNGAADAVSCLADTSCVVVGHRVDTTSTQLYWTATRGADGTWSAITDLPTPASGTTKISGLSCASASSCVAVFTGTDGSANALQWDGVQWTSTVLPQPDALAHPSTVNSVSCAVAGHCVAVGNNINGTPVVWTLDTGTWTPLVLDKQSYAFLVTGVSCVSTDHCVAVGLATRTSDSAHFALFLTLDAGTWTNTKAAASNTLAGVSCVSTTECYAVGQLIAAEIRNGAWLTVGMPKDTLTSVSCPATGTCAAAGFARTALRDTSGWDPAVTLYSTSRTPGSFSSVSCGAPGHCLAVGTLGQQSPFAPWVEAYE